MYNTQQKFFELKVGVQDIEEYPATISKFWISAKNLQTIYPHNEIFTKNVNNLVLENNIFGWKKCRGDGNCYFRAVITSFIIKISKPYMSLQYLNSFLSAIKLLRLEDSIHEFQISKNRVQLMVEDLITIKSAGNPIEAFRNCLSLIQDPEVDLDLVRVARLLTYTELVKCQDDEEYSIFFCDGIESITYDILEMNREGGDFSLVFLPKSLGIQVIQYMFLDTPSPTIQYFPENAMNTTLKVNLLRRGAHYDVLNTVQEAEIDNCSIEEGSYYFNLDPEYYTRFLNSIYSNNNTL